MTIPLVAKLGMDFQWPDILAARDSGRLLALDLELSRRCNFKCIYCYTSAGKPLPGELTFPEVADVVSQAKALGARKVIVVGGGEPLAYPRFRELMEFLRSAGLSTVIFTNGSGLDAPLAAYLHSLGAGVVLKMNSLDERTQDWLCGVEGAGASIRSAFETLLQAGYGGRDSLLGVATVVCRYNYDEIPAIWRWTRSRGLVPYVETLTPQGRGSRADLAVGPQELGVLFTRLAEIDAAQFGHRWAPHPPIAAMACHRHMYSCYVRSDGIVQSCSGVEVAAGDLHRQSLADILRTSPVIAQLRHSDRLTKGECATCELRPDCYGCRGVAYQMTGDFLAPDPLCWRSAAAREGGKAGGRG